MQLIKRHYLRRFITYILICCMLFNLPASVVLAGPEGAEVIHGQVSLQQSGLNTVIHASDKSVINYTSFDIARPEIVQFIQPGSNASVLNRILSANPTCIDGTLLANGRVFFVNPAGVIIGSGATINVNQLVASGLNMSNDSFINGQYEFVGGGGSVANYGDISAKSVYLVGKQVTNAGNINCPAGYVVMTAGDKVFLGQPGSSVIVEIGSFESPEADAQTPAEIINEGTVEAEGGTIIFAAAGDAFSRPIMVNTGSLSTSNANGDAGNISLQASDGLFDNTGIITTTSNSDAGGTITVVAGEVINTGTIDVSGTQGGTVALEATSRLGQFGTVNADGIDGDGGNISLTASGVVALSSQSVTTANAGVNGDGGDVIVYSPDTALFRDGALIEAKGGSVSGDGGFVEVSGTEHVEVFGSVVASAANGEAGQFLIDPRNITINDEGRNDGSFNDSTDTWTPTVNGSELDIDDLEGYLDDQSVTITTSGVSDPDGRDNQDGWVHFNAGRDLYDGTNHVNGSNYSLTVNADYYILLDSGIHFNGIGNVTLDAKRDITINAEVMLNSGLFTAHAGNSPYSGILSINQDITAGSMFLTAGNQQAYDTSGSRVYVGYTPVTDERNNPGEGTFDTTVDLVSTNPTTGDITIESVHDVFIGGKVQAISDVASLIGDVEGSAGYPQYGGDIITKSDVTAGGSIEFIGNAIDIDGNVMANGGNLVIKGRSSGDSDAYGPRGTVLDENAEWGNIDVATNKTLFASGDVSIIDYQNGNSGQMRLTGHNSLTIEAPGGGIFAPETEISVSGSELVLLSHADLDLGSFNFDLQNSTHLTLGSYGGSITAVDLSNGGKNANAADQWSSITATAKKNITLQGTGTITTKALNSTATNPDTGDISVTSDSGQVLATEDITANNGNISLTAIDTTNGGIETGGNIEASHGITLRGEVTAVASGPQTFDAGQGTLWAKDTLSTITKTGGDLTLGGDAGIDLEGVDAVTGDSVNVTDGALTIEDVVDAEGNLVASGLVWLQGDTGLNYIGGNIIGTGVMFSASPVDIELDGAGDQSIDAGSGVLEATGDIIKTTEGTLTIIAGGGVELTGDTSQRIDAEQDMLWVQNQITKTSSGAGDLTLGGLEVTPETVGIDLDGTVDVQTTGGSLTMEDDFRAAGDLLADQDITFEGSVVNGQMDGSGAQLIDAETGTLTASGTITKTTTGNLTLRGPVDIDLGGTVDVQLGSLIIENDFHAAGDLLANDGITFKGSRVNGWLDLAGDQQINAGGVLEATGDIIKTTEGTLTIIAGGGVELTGDTSQRIDAEQDMLWVQNQITKTSSGAGDLTLGGLEVTPETVGIDLDGTVDVQTTGGSLTMEDDFRAAGDLLADQDITFEGSVVNGQMDGSGAQLIDAETGTLTASGTITKTTTGNLTLSGAAGINLEGTVDVEAGDLIIEDGFNAAADLLASVNVRLNSIATLDGSGNQLIDAEGAVLTANNTLTKTGDGNLTLRGASGIDLDGTVEVKSGSLTLEDNTTVASGQMLKASDDVILADGKTLTGTSSLTIEATNGEIKAAGTGSTISVSGSTLTLKQGVDLDLLDFTFNNQSNTDLTAQSYNGSFTADNTNAANAADQWQSITATAEDNIELSGIGNINIASAGLSSTSGGVKIVSTGGTISTPGAGGKLDAPITGSSNGTTGVDFPGGGKAAIVIISKDTLKLDPGAELTANGTYGSVDDRSVIDFLNVIEGDKNPGNPIDVAVYLASNTGNINVSSPVTIAFNGAMVVDAYDTVEPFGIEFLNSLAAINWLEVCSRITPTLNYARDNDTLPYASDTGLFPGNGTYVLRGENPDVGTGAWILAEEEKPTIPERTPIEVEVTSTVVPVTPDISDVGQLESTTISNDLQWLGEELGLCEGDQQGEDENQCQEITQAYLAGAFLQASDMRPHQAAAQLRDLAELLHDTDGSRIAALDLVINEFAQPNVPPSPEQFASIGQAFTLHVNDGTHYAAASQWLAALGEYTMLLISEIGWSSDDSIAFVMGKYGPAVTEDGGISVIAFIQMHLEDIIG
ncbi:MAG: filamentous hemagglutinin N-terminal domain-containing protein [Planctomycetes bacterium]|nr:filamentous hemagglutinin N-terminal domain-containing protein [Planctomycetota bacterium]